MTLHTNTTQHLLLGLLAVTCSMAALPTTAMAHHGSDGPCTGPVVSTNGNSEMMVAPDSFRSQATLQLRTKTTKEATAEANHIMATIKRHINELDIPNLTLKTTRYNTHPVWEHHDKQRRVPIAYQHSQTLQFTLEGVEDKAKLTDYANKVFGAMAKVEGIQPGGLSWYISDNSPYEAELLRQAVKKAKQRAQIMADAAGSTLGGACDIQYHGSSHNPVPTMMHARGAHMAADSVMAAPQVESGQQTMQARVQAKFLITP